MTSEELFDLDREILAFLRGVSDGTAASVTSELDDRFDQEDIHAALWRLLNEGKLEWTPDFCFRVAKNNI